MRLQSVISGFAVALSIVFASLAGAHPTYTNEPTGLTQLYYCSFNNNSLCGASDSFNSLSNDFVSPGGSGIMASPPGALRIQTEGGHGAGQVELGFGKVREIFAGTTWRNQLYGYPNSTGKLFFLSDPSASFLVLQGLPGRNCKTIKWYQQERVDNSHISTVFGTKWNADRDGTGWFEPNTGNPSTACWGGPWVKIEVYLKGSTTSTSRDGIVRWWVNGQMAGNYTNVNQGTDLADFPGGFRYFAINHTWDGTAGVLSPGGEVWTHWWDEFYISSGTSTGPGGGGGTSPPPNPDTPAGPPAVPTGLNAQKVTQ